MLLVMLLAADEAAKPLNTAWQPVFKAHVAEMKVAPADGAAPALRSEPVFRWAQPVRGGDDAAVYIWTRNGRPELVDGVLAWPGTDGLRNVQHELHSLSGAPLSATWRGTTMLAAKSEGLKFADLAGAPEPAATAPRRMVQMRALLREFSAESIDHERRTTKLRGLPQPLFRYEPPLAEGLLDGGLFCFTEGTDPEILLLLEAARADGKSRWRWAAARFSDYGLRLQRGGAEIWRSENYQDEPDGKYRVTTIERRRKPEAPAPSDAKK